MSTPFTTKLEDAGYFKGLPPEKAQTLKDYFDQKGWDGIFADSHRFFQADAEDLAEGGVGEFIRGLEPFLTAQGVRLPQIEDDASANGYVVRVGDAPHRIYGESEIERETSSEQPGLVWGLSMVRSFGIVNELLEEAKSPERLYAIYGGNDLVAYFLTPELFQIIKEHPNASLKDLPYMPTEDYPWHGHRKDESKPTPWPESKSTPWPLWKQLLVAFLFGCVLLGLKLLFFK